MISDDLRRKMSFVANLEDWKNILEDAVNALSEVERNIGFHGTKYGMPLIPELGNTFRLVDQTMKTAQKQIKNLDVTMRTLQGEIQRQRAQEETYSRR